MAAKANKKKVTNVTKGNWNEFNTFSKLIYPYLQEELGYPPRKSKLFDEQTWVRKRGEQKGPYDGAFKNNNGIILLVEAKKEGKKLTAGDQSQLFDYCLGDSFAVPPPYAMLSNGIEFQWFRRLKTKEGDFSFAPCDEIKWAKALEQKGSGQLTEQLTLKQVVRLLKVIRTEIFNDLTDNYFPLEYSFKNSRLGAREKEFKTILETRKSFVDPTLEKAKEGIAIRSVLSSISLSLTLKALFLKIITDRHAELFPSKVKKEFKKYATLFPGILVAKPYDALEFSDICEEFISETMSSASITQALVFEDRDNPIGDIWDGLVESEELDLQVKSLGNVYTPPEIVNAMVDKVENSFDSWKQVKILEPACGSGHFVREVYKRIRDEYLGTRGNKQKVVNAHIKTIEQMRAVDIDPFAVQTTQLGMFLELYKTPSVWEAVAPRGKFNFGKVVDQCDFLDNTSHTPIAGFKPNLIIGNPPYGVKVTKELSKHFNTGSNDSYGCFIAQGLSILPDSGQLLLIVSSTFLTNRTYKKLRKLIFNSSKINSVYTLHRNAFSGRDVFCCIFDITKDKEAKNDHGHFYHYMDAWPIHPNKREYTEALKSWSSESEHNISKELLGDYYFPQHLMLLRISPPHPKKVDEEVGYGKFCVDLGTIDKKDKIYPIVAGRPSLYFLSAESPYPQKVRWAKVKFPNIGEIQGLEVARSERWIPIVKLWQLAQVRQGLATADDEKFTRKTPGVKPNARRQNIKDVDLRCTLSGDSLSNLTAEDKSNGIKVTDLKRDRYFVPFDKGGEQDTAKGELRAFWSPIDYWIDWSEGSVKTLKKRNKWSPGTPKKPRFQNKEHYFKSGIRFSPTGLYAPTFELSFGGVFGHNGSLILPFSDEITKYLLGVLCSPITRYLTKNFLQHTVKAEIDVVRQIPIPVPTDEQLSTIVSFVDKIIVSRLKGDYAHDEMDACWKEVYKLYEIPKEDEEEINTWFKRRYPHFGKANQSDV